MQNQFSFAFARWKHRTDGLAAICNCMFWLGGQPLNLPFPWESGTTSNTMCHRPHKCKWHLRLLISLSRRNKKSPANEMGNMQQRCMFESPVKQDLSQSPDGASQPAAKLSIMFYSYSPEGATCLAQPMPYRLKIANFFYPPLI